LEFGICDFGILQIVTATKRDSLSRILQSSALEMIQTKKRSSKLGVFSYGAIYS